MLNGAEIDVAMSFDSADLEAIADWQLADSGQMYVPASGSNGIESFVTMTFDAAHQAGAKGVADALRDRAVQVRMQDITVLGRRRSWTPRGRTRRGAAFATLPTAPPRG